MTTMDVFVTCWNEEAILPFFFRHYGSIARRIVLTDTGSTDRSIDIAMQAGAEIRHLDTGGEFREDLLTEYRNRCWRGTDADWIAVVDADEFIYHPNWMFLSTPATICIPTGYELFLDSIPADGQLYAGFVRGTRQKRWDKPVLFRPRRIWEMNFAPGNHTAEPKGDVRRYREPDLKLLHCSFLTPEYRLAKVRRIRARQSEVNRRYGWSFQYDDSDEAAMAKYRKLRRKAVPLILQDSQCFQSTRRA
ncbi:MAG: glycosyltransferase family 2 protein [Thermoguttaceae bacterium]